MAYPIRYTARPEGIALKTLFALPLAHDDIPIYLAHTGRMTAPTSPAGKGWFVAGRRGGKSAIAALAATYLATARDYRPCLRWGETAVAQVIAADKPQARIVFEYIAALLPRFPESAPALAGPARCALDSGHVGEARAG